jgi:alpha-tubulin suppressor-like RCC1 family protein
MTESLVPDAVLGASFYEVSAGAAHTCGLAVDSIEENETNGYCWGANSAGELGDGSIGDHRAPVKISDGLVFLQVRASSSAFTCGNIKGAFSSGVFTLVQAGAVYCWGENAFGRLGNGTTNNSSVPVLVAPPAPL